MKLKPLFAIGALSALALAGCSTPVESEPEPTQTAEAGPTLDSLYAAAKEEGSLTWYCHDPEVICNAVADGFEAEYPGVSVDVVRLASSEMAARFIAEKESNAPTADFLQGSSVVFFKQGLEDGLLTNYTEAGIPGFDQFPKEWVNPDGFPVALTAWVIAYNTDLVEKADVPASYEGLADPRWAGGKILMPDPTVSSAYPSGLATVAERFGGDKWLQALADQDPVYVTAGMIPASASLAAGEAELQGIANVPALVDLQSKGAPVDYVIPKQVTGSYYIWGLNAEAAHPNAARLFAAYIITEDANKIQFATNPGGVTAFLSPGDGVEVVLPDSKFESQSEIDRINAILVS